MEGLEQKAADIAAALEDGKGRDVVVMDVSELNSWTDYFVIATVTSSAHWQGLRRQVEEYAYDSGLEIRRAGRKSDTGDDWNLIDLGPIVVHLMSEDARSFYDLEALWHSARMIERKSLAEKE